MENYMLNKAGCMINLLIENNRYDMQAKIVAAASCVATFKHVHM